MSASTEHDLKVLELGTEICHTIDMLVAFSPVVRLTVLPIEPGDQFSSPDLPPYSFHRGIVTSYPHLKNNTDISGIIADNKKFN